MADSRRKTEGQKNSSSKAFKLLGNSSPNLNSANTNVAQDKIAILFYPHGLGHIAIQTPSTYLSYGGGKDVSRMSEKEKYKGAPLEIPLSIDYDHLAFRTHDAIINFQGAVETESKDYRLLENNCAHAVANFLKDSRHLSQLESWCNKEINLAQKTSDTLRSDFFIRQAKQLDEIKKSVFNPSLLQNFLEVFKNPQKSTEDKQRSFLMPKQVAKLALELAFISNQLEREILKSQKDADPVGKVQSLLENDKGLQHLNQLKHKMSGSSKRADLPEFNLHANSIGQEIVSQILPKLFQNGEDYYRARDYMQVALTSKDLGPKLSLEVDGKKAFLQLFFADLDKSHFKASHGGEPKGIASLRDIKAAFTQTELQTLPAVDVHLAFEAIKTDLLASQERKSLARNQDLQKFYDTWMQAAKNFDGQLQLSSQEKNVSSVLRK